MKFRMILAVLLLAGCTSLQPGPTPDTEIAMIMRVANLAEVREGELARSKTTDASVRDFAIMMVTEHTAQSNKAEAELARVDIFSSDTDTSRQLDAESGATTERLRALSGAAFDRAYIDRQVSAHQSLISMIDTNLMPKARKKQVKEQLTELRKLAERHLTRAKQIQGSLPR
jgi:putative membrane protein